MKTLTAVKTIESFRGSNYFLSNFYPHIISYRGVGYQTIEHAFQAAKTEDPEERRKIARAETPGKAKAMGRKVDLREGWEIMRLEVMGDLLWEKFSNPVMRSNLMETGNTKLIEGNDWYDHFWGRCNACGEGANHLGRLLMAVRAVLQEIYLCEEETYWDCRRNCPGDR